MRKIFWFNKLIQIFSFAEYFKQSSGQVRAFEKSEKLKRSQKPDKLNGSQKPDKSSGSEKPRKSNGSEMSPPTGELPLSTPEVGAKRRKPQKTNKVEQHQPQVREKSFSSSY